MADLAELLERVTAATGPDRELDAALLRAFGFQRTAGNIANSGSWKHGDGSWLSASREPVTASLDAALALVERVLPTIPLPEPYGPWEWRVHGPNRNDAGMCRAALMWPQTEAGAHVKLVGPAYGKTPALAILAAMLSALIAQPASGDVGTAQLSGETT